MAKELCGKELRGGKVCARSDDHKGQHRSVEAIEKQLAYKRGYNREYYRENVEQLRDYQRGHYRENTERRLNWQREYYLENAEQIKDRVREYSRENREAIYGRNRGRRALLASVYSEPYTRDDVLRAWGPICYLCDSIIPDDWHLEHVIPISKGGHDTVGNIRPACPVCNLRKHDKLHPIYQLAHCELVRAA